MDHAAFLFLQLVLAANTTQAPLWLSGLSQLRRQHEVEMLRFVSCNPHSLLRSSLLFLPCDSTVSSKNREMFAPGTRSCGVEVGQHEPRREVRSYRHSDGLRGIDRIATSAA